MVWSSVKHRHFIAWIKVLTCHGLEMCPGSVIWDLSCVVELSFLTTSFRTSRGRWNQIGHYWRNQAKWHLECNVPSANALHYVILVNT